MIKRSIFLTLPAFGIVLATQRDDRLPTFKATTQVHPGLRAPYVNFDTGLTRDWETEVVSRINQEQLKNEKT